MKRTTTKILTGISALALIAATPVLANAADPVKQSEAQAGSSEQKVNPRGPVVTKEDIKQGWEDTKKSVSDTATDVSNAIEEKYDDAKAVVIGEDQTPNKTYAPETYTMGNSSATLLGRKVLDSNGKTVASVHDIILDPRGDARLLVLEDGAFFGIGGKKVALDYDKAVSSESNVEIIHPVSKDVIGHVAEFSYDMKASGNVRTLPANGMSLREHIKGAAVLDPQGKKLGSVDNVNFKSGKANSLIVGFDKTLGMGGEDIALSFDAVKAMRKDEKVEFQLSSRQSASLENYRKSMSNN